MSLTFRPINHTEILYAVCLQRKKDGVVVDAKIGTIKISDAGTTCVFETETKILNMQMLFSIAKQLEIENKKLRDKMRNAVGMSR
jgi:hypothetical protein